MAFSLGEPPEGTASPITGPEKGAGVRMVGCCCVSLGGWGPVSWSSGIWVESDSESAQLTPRLWEQERC